MGMCVCACERRRGEVSCDCVFAGMIANDLSCRAPAKFAFLELADPSQLDWVLSLNNWPIPHCPTVSQLSCDLSMSC